MTALRPSAELQYRSNKRCRRFGALGRLAGCALVLSWTVHLVLLSSVNWALATPGADASADSQPLIFGASLSLTGKLAFTGISQQRGLELAAEDINADGGIRGRRLELRFDDNSGDPKNAVAGLQQMLSTGLPLGFFTSFSHITNAVRGLLADRSIVVLYAAAVRQPAAEHRHFFRDWADAPAEGRALAQRALGQRLHRLGYIGEENEGCASFLAGSLEEFKRAGVMLAAEESYAPGEIDFRSLLLRARANNVDGLILCVWRDEATFMAQLKAAGMIGLPTFHVLAPLVRGGDTPDTRRLWEENRAISVWVGFIEGQLSPRQEAFAERYRKAYHDEMTMEAVLAYDDLRAFAQAAERCPLADPASADCIAENLSRHDGEGVGGRLVFDASRLSSRRDLLITVKGGKWVPADSPS